MATIDPNILVRSSKLGYIIINYFSIKVSKYNPDSQ